MGFKYSVPQSLGQNFTLPNLVSDSSDPSKVLFPLTGWVNQSLYQKGSADVGT